MRRIVLRLAIVAAVVVAAALLLTPFDQWDLRTEGPPERVAVFVRYTEGKANTSAAIVRSAENGDERVQCDVEGLKPGDRVRVQIVGAEDNILDPGWIVGRAP